MTTAAAQRLLAAILWLTSVAAGQSVPRTPNGHPDLQGIWTNATITPLERPRQMAGKATLTDEEAAVLERQSTAELSSVDFLFVDQKSEFARVDGVKRTSLIVDPPDGKVPPLTPEARKHHRVEGFGHFLSLQDRSLSERCLLGLGSTSGPPMLPVPYNSNYQIVQTPEYVMILVEMVHDARIIRMNGTHPSGAVRQWLGDSIGHWDGDTLVVDTTNFTDKTQFHGASANLHVTERFTRKSDGTILYRATVDDPDAFLQPWTLEYPFVATRGPIYEYACHEGNYFLTDILGGERK